MAFIALCLSVISCDSKKMIPPSELPHEITGYLSTYFPNDNILQSMVEKDGFKKSYEIVLSSNTNLEFNRQKEIVDIDGNTKLPDAVIPEKIRDYVAKNLTGRFITDWGYDDRGQQVKLDNGMELKFSKQGDFIRIDD